MNKKHVIGYAATALVAFAIGGGSSSGDAPTPVAAPAVTKTVTAPGVTKTVAAPAVTHTVAAPAVTVTRAAPAKPAGDSFAQTLMQATWDSMSASERNSICDGWSMTGMQDYFLDIFMESSGGQFDRAEAKAFFDAKC